MQHSFSTSSEQALQGAISTISQSDPLIKLLQQVRFGRMKPTDVGLRAVTESWLEIYENALSTAGLSQSDFRRLNPAPRLEVLIEVGVLTDDHPGVMSLKASYDRALVRTAGE
ncbi:MAG: hypothetical protein KF876_12670 [Nitrospira sp.]|nr:hypothetical protein [Nitrospira sp.]